MMLIREDADTTPRVVVVEDDPTVAWLIGDALADEGYAPVIVHNGRAAMRAVQEHRPHVMTLDLNLPDVDGRAILRRLRDVESTDRPRVVVVSSGAEWLTREERLGVAGALSKPFDLDDLVQAVGSVDQWREP